MLHQQVLAQQLALMSQQAPQVVSQQPPRPQVPQWMSSRLPHPPPPEVPLPPTPEQERSRRVQQLGAKFGVPSREQLGSSTGVPSQAPQQPPPPPLPKPAPSSPGAQMDWNAPEVVEAERLIFKQLQVRMKDRGPPPPSEGGPQSWKGQVWRESGQRWGNRGGKRKEEFAEIYRQQRARGEGAGGSSSSSAGPVPKGGTSTAAGPMPKGGTATPKHLGSPRGDPRT